MSTRPFRFGVINEQMLAPGAWLAHVRRMERLGYDTFLIRDHLVPDYFGEQYAPLVALAAAAGATERLIAERGWHGVSPEAVWAMPSFFVGDVAQIAATMVERRARYGFSYYVFSDAQAEELAPLVARLAGQ